MNSTWQPVWDRVQLALLRWLATILALADQLFNVHWGERLLESLASRWQAQLAELDDNLAHLEEERQRLHLQTEALAIHAAALYLGGRSLARGELRFDPADPQDDRTLDAAIDLLVKESLAAVETEEIEPRCYVYHLEPDWVAIRARLAEATRQAEPQLADWFGESLRFIDEAFPSETSPISGPAERIS
ncbi:hypothetical protein ACFLWA_03215 [Chloroflexota bacterium]